MSWRVLVLSSTLLLIGVGSAQAYPYFQITSGTSTCVSCHVSPAGGGLLTPWGRDEAGDTLSDGGDGAFLHGLVELPEWLSLQGEFRVAGLVNDTGSPDGAETAFFPMQTDVIAGFDFGQVGGVVSLGYRGQVRTPELQMPSGASTVADQDALSFLISREHYLYWKSEGTGPYARAGRFFAPYGLRVSDHNAYIRRYLGSNLMEEPYGISGGLVEASWEAHVSAFVSDPLRGNGKGEGGVAGLYERRFGNHVVAAQTRLTLADADVRILGGGYAKLWLEPLHLLWMTELDVGRQVFRDVDGGDRWQLAAYTGPVYNPAQGVYVGLAYELFDSDLTVSDVTRHAFGGWVSYMPRAHFEVRGSVRGQLVGPSDGAVVGLLQLHYYL